MIPFLQEVSCNFLLLLCLFLLQFFLAFYIVREEPLDELKTRALGIDLGMHYFIFKFFLIEHT